MTGREGATAGGPGEGRHIVGETRESDSGDVGLGEARIVEVCMWHGMRALRLRFVMRGGLHSAFLLRRRDGSRALGRGDGCLCIRWVRPP